MGSLSNSVFSLAIFFLNRPPDPPLRWLLALLSPCALAQALDEAIQLDETGEGA